MATQPRKSTRGRSASAAKRTTSAPRARKAAAPAAASAAGSDETVELPPAVPPPPPAPPAPESSARTPRLMRSRTDRVLGGVAGGIGQHLGIDPVIVRLVFVVLVLAGGSGLLAYLIAWIVIPEAPKDAEPAPARPVAAGDSTARIAGLGLIALGALLLAERLLPAFSWRLVAPLLLIVLGILLLLRRGGSR